MKRIQRTLLIEFYSVIIIALVLVVLFENEWIIPFDLSDSKSVEFAFTTTMELLTLISLPAMLRLFKFKYVHNEVLHTADYPTKLLLWGSIRIIVMGLLIIINALLYYSFMNVAFGYMAIISLLCMSFIYPSMHSCMSETA